VAVPLLGESLDTLTLVFALAVVVSVFAGRRFGAAPAPTPSRPTTAAKATP
jgi:hypothetical protein